MIFKILSGLLGALLIVGLFYYIPDLRFWGKKADKTSTELTDSVKVLRAQLASAAKTIAQKSASLQQIETDYQKSLAKQAAIIPQIKLDVSGLSVMQQRLAILESLIAQGLLKPADTNVKTPVVSYNLPEQTALTIQLRICDSLKTHNFVVERKIATLERAYQFRGDSMLLLRDWIEEGKTIADQHGWFTGRNKRLRQHSQSPPVFK